MIKTPPRVDPKAFELYHHLVSTIGLFIVPVEPCNIRLWGFEPMMDQLDAIDANEIINHRYELRALASHCMLPCPDWLKSALRINQDYVLSDDDAEEVYADK